MDTGTSVEADNHREEPSSSPEQVDTHEDNEKDQSDAQNGQTSGMSKNQLKKMKKLERKLERRKELRILEKQRKKEKRKALKDQGLGESLKKRKYTSMEQSTCKQRIVVDMAYEHLMNPNLIRNTIAQLTFCYSANRRIPNPSQYHITGVSGETRKLFDELEGSKGWDVHVHEEPLEKTFDSSEIVYLTSDSDNTLEQLNENDVYVIGGLLDHNRYPEASLKRAEANNWRHAKLPIGEFVKMNSRKVLTINQVFEILLQFMEHNNWEDAFFKVIPKRKGAQKINEDTESAEKDDSEENSQSNNAEDPKHEETNEADHE
uniref:tRNA (guanine(9)-N(1))-methyltransferase n=1 Tax=Bursaphelenchus xylophilus TaxID=6326 RepID=A0A1I7S554_BURXY